MSLFARSALTCTEGSPRSGSGDVSGLELKLAVMMRESLINDDAKLDDVIDALEIIDGVDAEEELRDRFSFHALAARLEVRREAIEQQSLRVSKDCGIVCSVLVVVAVQVDDMRRDVG